MDIDIGLAKIEKIAIHRIGNKLRDEELALSNRESTINEQIERMILSGYLRSIIKSEQSYSFFHETDVQFNEVSSFSRSILDGSDTLLEASKKIAKHLYSQTSHPNISAGELIVILFSEMLIDNKKEKAIGIFKSEVKDEYLTINESSSSLVLEKSTGINPSLIDKGALIFESDHETVFTVDRFGHKTKYWIDDFLKLKPIQNQKTNSEVATKILKLLPEKLTSPKDREELKGKLEVLTATSNSISLSNIKEIACQHIPEKEYIEISEKASRGYNLEINESIEFESKKLAKKINQAFSKFKLTDGIELIVNSAITVNAITSHEDSENIFITIKAGKL